MVGRRFNSPLRAFNASGQPEPGPNNASDSIRFLSDFQGSHSVGNI